MTDGSAPGDVDIEIDIDLDRAPDDRPTPSSGPIPWLVATGVTVLAAVLGLTLALRTGSAPACAAGRALAAPPTGTATHTGKATFYDSNGAGGNCSNPAAPANRLYVALGPTEYAAGAACGGFLDVTGPKGTIRVLIMDQCPECEPGHLDLSREAFARIADPVQGLVPVTYRAVVNPPLPGPLTFRIKEGASQFWFAVRVGNHGNPLRTVEVRQRDDGPWQSAARQDYNYWLIASGAGAGPFTIRVSDVYGNRATVAGIRMAPGQVQTSTVRMYGRGAAPANRRPSASARPSSNRPAGTPTPARRPAEVAKASAPATAVANPPATRPAGAVARWCAS
ncbi:Peptidoglycan-binding domain-containing protein, expansin [Micromonospora coriariae]|uniref:Peptidoglycan-binding domain-containing protein, expansin n=1 Tax=Micromonospora coriariae TaxID=285665 RepID=A0A1C4V0D5_9ACTN|nr:expansin EXLX1 family cellulose-binding protein [Micromonospora coriariae]SCE77422.1 Peptidoglycan-binding domain-containing protein, expansin [Micromonospora coriariae]